MGVTTGPRGLAASISSRPSDWYSLMIARSWLSLSVPRSLSRMIAIDRIQSRSPLSVVLIGKRAPSSSMNQRYTSSELAATVTSST